MAISWVGSATTLDTNVSSQAVGTPSGAVEGDILLAHIGARQSGSSALSITTPSGWTLIASTVNYDGSYTMRFSLFYRVATSSTPSTYTFSFSGTASFAHSAIALIRGVNTGSPVNAFNTNTINSETDAPSIAGVSTTIPGCILIPSIASPRSGTGAIEFESIPDGYTLGYNTKRIAAAYTIQDHVGSSGNVQFDLEISQTFACLMVALAPKIVLPPISNSYRQMRV